MHLRCSEKGLQLQEGKGSLSFGLADSIDLTMSRAHPLPLPALGTQVGRRGSLYLGALEYKVLSPQRSDFRVPEAVALGRGLGPQLGGKVGWLGGDIPALSSLFKEPESSRSLGALM